MFVFSKGGWQKVMQILDLDTKLLLCETVSRLKKLNK